MGDSQYSFSLTTFSPSGKLVQIEHALTAVGSGQTSLGIKAANGVVIATEKKLPSILVDETSVQKIQCLTPNIGVVYSGMGPDFRVLVRKSRKQAEQYHRLYKEPIPVTQLVREIAAVMQEFTQSGGVRPFGVSLLVAGYDDNGPQLYQVDPSGSYFSWKASAMGKNVSNAKTFLEKRYTDDMELDDAVHTAILTLKEGFEGQISGKNIEIGIIGTDKKFRQAPASTLSSFLKDKEWNMVLVLWMEFLNPIAQQILDFLRKEVDADRIWGSVDNLPPTHATWLRQEIVEYVEFAKTTYDTLILYQSFAEAYIYAMFYVDVRGVRIPIGWDMLLSAVMLRLQEVLVAWWGTVAPTEKYSDLRTSLQCFGKTDIKVQSGFLGFYNSKGKEVSLTLCGHSLGGALARLNAYDAATYFPDLFISVICFAAPRVAITGRLKWIYSYIMQLKLDVLHSPYLRCDPDYTGCLSKFRWNTRRDVASLNKSTDMLIKELKIPKCWYERPFKGFVLNQY
ncbi:Proteasome subunit alpha type-2 [Hibiscus syriacus]|uniref:Proteasome subunit alpha type-2 n=1 Tax=Hibiscus syriacus TaxID=106335 RepID=A0A6A3C212_HIBSY|nr:Proteasome subunit alpha type-2 [Hibiscus syriacus]